MQMWPKGGSYSVVVWVQAGLVSVLLEIVFRVSSKITSFQFFCRDACD